MVFYETVVLAMGATASLELQENVKEVPWCPTETLKMATWSTFGQLSSRHCCAEDQCEVRRKVKELCMTTDEQCMTYSTAGISTCDESLVVCSCGTPRAQDASTLGSATMSTRQEWMGTAGRAEPHSSFVANSLKSKCLEVETLCTVKRNLLEHGLPLMLRTVVLGNRFAEYFVCIHKGGEHFSLLDRKVSRDKNNFHYAWEDMQKYHFVEYDGHTEEAGEVANERKELWTNGYYTREMMRCTFSESCCPQQMDMMFRSKEALQCVVDIFDSKLKARRNQTSQTSISPSTQTPSCHGAFNLEDWAWTPSSPEHQVWVPSPESTPQAVNPSTPLPTMAWPSPSPKSAEVLIQPPETDSERPPDWASMSERSLNSFYAV